MARYDLCIIGAGPAGFAAAMRAWDYGKRVCLIERGLLGGAGIHNGALSSKTLWELSRDYRRASAKDRGFSIQGGVHVDFAQVVRCVNRAMDERTGQMQHQLDTLSTSCDQWPGSIRLVRGSASFIDPHRVRVDGAELGRDHEIEADNFLIATGSRPRLLPDIPVDGKIIMTSDHLMQLERFPKSLVILGAGVVGCEFATIFANYGQTKVNIIDRADRILPFEDLDISEVCTRNLEEQGVTVHQRAHLVSMRVVGGRVEYTIQYHTGGQETFRVERALISVGRVPNTEALGLEKTGIELSDRGHILDEDTRTSVSHIYAAGDVTYDIALVNVGEIEGRHAVERMFSDRPSPLSYDNLSTIMFLDPEVAAIGMNEQQAQAKRLPYRVATYSYGLVGRAIAMRATGGFVKMLVSDDDEMKILGMRALGAHASTTIEAVSLMIAKDLCIHDLAELLHPHPAITEALQECVRMLLGSSIFKPQVFTTQLRVSRITYSADDD